MKKDCYGRRWMKKKSRERLQAVERALFQSLDARRTGWCPFHDATKSGRVRRTGPDDEAFTLHPLLTCLNTGWRERERERERERDRDRERERERAVSYTHLTLPTTAEV